jgi:hypothetical protein
MVKEPRRLVFVVEQNFEGPTDLETLRQKQSRVAFDKPDEWYALGDWAAGRGKFYQDDDLLREAQTAYLKGFDLERRAVREGDAGGLFALADKAATLGLPVKLRAELIHEAYQIRWQAIQKEKEPALKEFAEQLARDLPGAAVPLQPPESKLGEDYWKGPAAAYQAAADDDRRKLHRVFYAQVLESMIVRQAAADGSNGAKIAAEIDRQIPERAELAEDYRQRELDYRIAQVGTATRQEMLELVNQFRKSGREELIRRTIEKWLETREKRLRQDGPAGLVQSADDRLELLDDKKTAVALLIEADRANPGSQEMAGEIAKRLNRLGYQQTGGQWASQGELHQQPTDPVQQAMREGRVAREMTADQVRKTLGAPTSRTRVLTHEQISEVWFYGPRGSSRLAIHFTRRLRSEPAEAKVVNISQLSR